MGQKSSENLSIALNELVKRGFLNFRNGRYYVRSIVQAVAREKLKITIKRIKNLALNCTKQLKGINEDSYSELSAYVAVAKKTL